MNAVVIAVLVMLGLSLFRINVVLSLTLGALIGGVVGGMGLEATLQTFSEGLGGGSTVALSYALLGAFAVAIERSGLPTLMAAKVLEWVSDEVHPGRLMQLKWIILSLVLLVAIASQNLVPVHIAFIPILIPPLLNVLRQFQLDRRLMACILTFGLTMPYMLLPVGFGAIFLHEILLKNLQQYGLQEASAAMVPQAMMLPVLGMVGGLLVAMLFSYRKPRQYPEWHEAGELEHGVDTRTAIVTGVAVLAAFVVQLLWNSIILGALLGYGIFVAGGVVRWGDSNSVFSRGMQMMAQIGFVMISAAGFAAVMKATGHVDTLVSTSSEIIGDNRALAALAMLLVGLLITMGIGSSFSTVPIIAAVYVPLALQLGFSPLATIALVGTAGALGDAGSPASDSTLGPTMGLNADGRHDHIWDSVVPTFLHYNIPLILFGWIAALVL